jgi:hypothetical protein
MTFKLSNIITAESMYRQDVEASARACVEEGGGIWAGIQKCEGMLYDLALFNSRKTRSTLALKTTEITPDAVRRRIKNSNEQFRRASISRRDSVQTKEAV